MEQVEILVGGVSIKVSRETAAKGIAFMVELELGMATEETVTTRPFTPIVKKQKSDKLSDLRGSAKPRYCGNCGQEGHRADGCTSKKK